MFTLYLITDGADSAGIAAAVEAALAGAPSRSIAVQLRAKDCDGRTLFALAEQLRAITSQRGAALLINERVDIALSVRADGVQLPERGLPVHAARKLLGSAALIGLSCHGAGDLERAHAEGASFACLSPVFESPGKGPALGLERFRELCARARLPVYALGGIRAQHAPQLRAAGACGLAVISEVFSQTDKARAVASCLDAWQGARP